MSVVPGVLASRRSSRVAGVFLSTCFFLAQGITHPEERKIVTSWDGDNLEDEDLDVSVVNATAFTQVKEEKTSAMSRGQEQPDVLTQVADWVAGAKHELVIHQSPEGPQTFYQDFDNFVREKIRGEYFIGTRPGVTGTMMPQDVFIRKNAQFLPEYEARLAMRKAMMAASDKEFGFSRNRGVVRFPTWQSDRGNADFDLSTFGKTMQMKLHQESISTSLPIWTEDDCVEGDGEGATSEADAEAAAGAVRLLFPSCEIEQQFRTNLKDLAKALLDDKTTHAVKGLIRSRVIPALLLRKWLIVNQLPTLKEVVLKESDPQKRLNKAVTAADHYGTAAMEAARNAIEASVRARAALQNVHSSVAAFYITKGVAPSSSTGDFSVPSESRSLSVVDNLSETSSTQSAATVDLHQFPLGNE
ncbi:unnamed protein product [Amoebophrya sp. A25]|nr:unnamed protein product [Amoebophrya sp. A25]|eukprot:GSA25T00007284001.1